MSFFTALKAKFDQSQLLLSASIVISEQFDYNRFNLAALSESVEFITVIPNHKFGSTSPVEATRALGIASLREELRRLIESGVPLSKIVLGLDFTGFGFTTIDEENIEFDRVYRYNEVTGLRLTEPRKWKVIRDEPSFTVVANKKENRLIVVESSRSIANKVRYATKLGVAGVAPASVSFDEFYGVGKIDENTFVDFVPIAGVDLTIPTLSERKYPLFNAINETIVVAENELLQEAELTEKPQSPEIPIDSTPPPIDNSPTETAPENQLSPELLATNKNKKIICEVPLPSQVDPKIGFDIKNVDWNLCTHLVSIDSTGNGMKLFGNIPFFFGYFNHFHSITAFISLLRPMERERSKRSKRLHPANSN